MAITAFGGASVRSHPPAKGSPLRYFLDTEFNGFGGALISLALVRADGSSLYLVYDAPEQPEAFVRDHVQPNLERVPESVAIRRVKQSQGAYALEAFLQDDADVEIIADWPDDVRLCCQALMIEPDLTANIGRLRFEIHRVDPYPTDLVGAVRHNAWWDAMALRQKLATTALAPWRHDVTGSAHTLASAL